MSDEGTSSTGFRRILVTGATGFVGRHLVRRLTADGVAVHALVRPQSNLAPLQGLSGLSVHLDDGGDRSIGDVLDQAAPELVIHLATHFVGEHGPGDLGPMVAANILFGARLLEAMADTGPACLVNAGTSWQAFEDREGVPVNLYAATKQAFEDLLAYYTEAAGLRAVTLRLFDSYGPDDPRRKLMNLLTRAADEGQALVMSPGEQLLDLVYIDDVISGFLRAAALVRDMAGGHQVYALSGGDRRSLREVVETFSRAAGKPVTVEWGGKAYRVREVMVPWSQGRTLPGWRPRVSLEEGIGRMLAGDV